MGGGDVIQQSIEQWDNIKTKFGLQKVKALDDRLPMSTHDIIRRDNEDDAFTTETLHKPRSSITTVRPTQAHTNPHSHAQSQSQSQEAHEQAAPSPLSTEHSDIDIPTVHKHINYPPEQFAASQANILKSEQGILNYDVRRCLRMATFGLVVVGPLCHNWYIILESLIQRADLAGAVAKMAIDQSIMAPISTVLFFSSMSLMEGRTLTEGRRIVEDKTWPTLLVNWKIWPLAQVINMYFVPVSLRVLFLNVVGLGYNTILSRIANSK